MSLFKCVILNAMNTKTQRHKEKIYQMKKNFFCAVLLLLCPVMYGQNSDSGEITNRRERIINFHSDIVIDTTGIIRVTESIRLYAGGDDIKRGIVRSIPVYRTNIFGKKIKMNVDVISVICNGQYEKYEIKKAGENKEIFIGDPDVYLEPGIYNYIIIYESAGQVGFFDDKDELYWNVTGTDWVFPIERASACITLPNDVQSIETSCYTGSHGSTTQRCSSQATENKVCFVTDHSLFPYEGLTVAVSFPRDIIRRPPPPSPSELFWENYKYHISAFLCLLIFGIFFYSTWRKVGKNPEKPVVYPTFKPPHDRSPAATRYLHKRKYDDKAFTAALVSMAVKKVIRISNKNKQYTLESLESLEPSESLKNNTTLSSEEQKIYYTLFTDNKSITVTDKNHKKFADANTNLTTSLQASWNLKDYFLKNQNYVAWGTALLLALIILYILLTANITTEAVFLFTVPFIGLAIMLMTMKKFGKSCFAYFFKFLGICIFGIPSFIMSVAAFVIIATSLKDSWVNGTFVLALFILYGLYVYLIKAPTKLGAQTFSELEGFKMYLKTAEEHRLNFLTPPEKTPELFEKLLPYAIALDVENEWGKKFTDILKQFNYEPDWYNGDKSFTSSNFPSSFARSFTSSVGSARINPASSSSSGGSWSSGSSGGGHSGGGGGGGGGRGW